MCYSERFCHNYPEKSKDYRFYCPDRQTKFVETRHAVFLEDDLEENIYMAQPKDFVMEEKERMGCHLKKSIYGLKQASRQWYLKFDSTIRKFGFQKNVEDNCVYVKFKNRKFIFLVLYIDDILLAGSDVSLLLETEI